MPAANIIGTVDGGAIAAALCKSQKTFRNIRPVLHAAGMPQPLALPGNPVWLVSEIDAWLLSRSQAASPTCAPTPPLAADGDAPAAYELTPSPADSAPTLKHRRGRPSKAEQDAASARGLSVSEFRKQGGAA